VYKTNLNTRSLRSALLLGATSAVAMSLTAPALAQDQGATETVVVTGSRIPQQGLYASSPVTSVGQGEIKLEGTTDIETLLDNLPSVFVSQNSTSNNGSSGTSTINLRDLGAARTLVLIDGTRLMPGDPTLPAADVNTIPTALVDHVEVLTGGASAVYGSDAVAGVVNFIMRKDFEGVELDGQYTVDEHSNDNSYAQGLYNAAGFTNPLTGAPVPGAPGVVWDGASEDATVLVGTNTGDGKGNVTAYMGYRNSAPVLEASRDYSACTLADASATSRVCAGSANYSLYVSLDNALTPHSTQPVTFFGTGNGSVGSGKLVPFIPGQANEYFNYGGLNYLQRNDLRYNGGFFAHYEVHKSLDIYTSFMFTDDKSTAQLAPSAVFYGDGPISGAQDVNCTNPYLTAQENQALCGGTPGDVLIATGPTEAALGHPYYNGAGNLTPGQATVLIGRRDIEGGDRTYSTEHESYRMKLGSKGDLGDGWTYDVYGQFGYTSFNEDDGGQFSKARVENALNVDPITGQCTGGQTGCVGLDIFNGFGGITPSMLGYVEVPGLLEGFTQEQILSGSITGDLGQYGIQSPWAKSPVAISLGGEYRSETLGLTPDLEESSGDLEGGGAVPAEHGSFNVTEGFTEVQVPVIEGMPFVQDFSLNGGYRYSSYNIAGSTVAYKYGAEWQPIDDFRIRGSFERAVRAPNILELFSPDTLGLFSGQDPCSAKGIAQAGSAAGTVTANCESAPGSAKVSSTYVGSLLLNCISSQCSGTGGGSTTLKPEISNTHTLGLVFTPTFFDGFTATVDYFDIQVANAIGVIPPTATLAECYGPSATHASQVEFCPLVERNESGIPSINGSSGSVFETNINTGSLGTKGFDFEGNYNVDLASWGAKDSGSLSFNLIGTLLNNLTTEPYAGAGTYDCAGLYGLTCGTPSPRWRHKLRVTWTSPWDFSLSLAWRYFGQVGLDSNTSQALLTNGSDNVVEGKLPAYNWFDLAGEWNVAEGVSLRAGINNLFDREPPITAIQPLPEGNGNTFPGTYDPFGRVIFIGGTIKY
jgi:iron complex outermembrane recepter protein